MKKTVKKSKKTVSKKTTVVPTTPAQTVHNEKDMREQPAAHPKTLDDLMAEIQRLTSGTHDYGTCVYAMSLAATATFNYVAGQLGVTGFQASCADMDILRRTRGMDGPFKLTDVRNALYPQYDLVGDLQEYLHKCEPYLKEEAQKLLVKHKTDQFVSPHVYAHWKKLAGETE